MSKGSTTWSYTYDANGMRTSRTNGTTTYNYIYNGDKLTEMTKGSTKLTFTYDAAGTPLTVTYNGTRYYYKTNLQGDVTDILNSSGTTVVSYVYDAYGRIRSKSGSLIDTLGFDNPLRYRGYVYDVQTEFYYLQSRYYYPTWGRFINADEINLLMEGLETPIQANLFVYCWNNPVNMVDPDGYWALAVAGGGYLAAAGTFGFTNMWNPVGWVILGTVVITTVVAVGINVYESVKSSYSNEVDPYARPGQKKQGRERKSKARKSKDWKPRSNPKPPKKHTPGRGHRKYK